MRTQAWLEISGLSLKRGGRRVLRDITMAAREPALGVVGANGAGKTSLIGCLLGLLKPEKGLIRTLDLQIPEQSLEFKTRCGVMLEDAGIFPGGSGLEAVVFAGSLCGMSRSEAIRQAHEVLDNLDVDEERFRKTQTYSVGMKQRIKLAMSLIHEPELLILDEPTIGLDHQGRRLFLQLIRKLRDQGVRILFTTHILSDAEQICDEIMLLSEGELKHFGAVDSMIESSEHLYRVRVGGGAARLASVVAELGFAVKRVDDDGLLFQINEKEDFRAFWRAVDECSIEIRELGPATKSLEAAVVQAMESRNA